MNNGQSAAKQIATVKPIPGWEDKYGATRDGKIYSYITLKYLKPAISKDGYECVSLAAGKKGVAFTYKVHKLVATTYLENPENLSEINHKDFNRLNNYVDNLEWCSHYDNIKYTRDAGGYDCIYNQTRTAYVFTNVYNGKTFTIIGFNNMMKQMNLKRGNNSVIHRNANTGKYITKGVLKGLKVDIIDLEVRRPTAINGVDSSESK